MTMAGGRAAVWNRRYAGIILALVLTSALAVGEDAPRKTMVGPTIKPQKMQSRTDGKMPPESPESGDALLYKSITGNLLKNGSFEKGRYWPYGWEPVDKLSSFWETSGGSHGKRCLRFFTKPEDGQATKWNAKVRALIDELKTKTKGRPQSVSKNPLPPPPQPDFPSNKYATVGGIHGTVYLSEPIKLKPGGIYRITFDIKNDTGKGGMIIFVKGYFFYKQHGRYRNCGRLQKKLVDATNEWRRVSIIFHPSTWTSVFGQEKVRAEHMKIQLYSYWPPGNYYWDNVKLDIIGFEPYEAFGNPKDVETKRKPRPPKTPQKGDDELKPGEFPVFD